MKSKTKFPLNKTNKAFVTDEAKKLYSLGYSTREIAEMLPVRVTHQTIAQIVKGLPRKLQIKSLDNK